MIASFFAAIVLASGQLCFASVILQAQNSIDGMVTSTDRRPVVNARVFLQNDSYSEVASAYTDGSGRFTFRGLPSNIYNITVESADGTLERQSQRVAAIAQNGRASGRGGERFRVDFVLMPKKPAIRNGEHPIVQAADGTVFYQDVPEAARKEYGTALKSFERNEFDRGVVSLKEALDLFPDYYDALERLGTEYVKRHDFGSAVPFLEHAVEINKNGWSSFYYLGVARIEMKQADEAVRVLRRAVEINPNSVNANMRLGMILATNADTREEAIKSLRKVTELAGKQVPDSYLRLAKLYSDVKQYREAADALEAYMKLIPPSEAQQREQYRKLIEQLRHKASKS